MCFILISEKKEINLKKEKKRKKSEENPRKDIILVLALIFQ